MIEPPAFNAPLTEGRSRVCLEAGTYRAYLDHAAALEFLFSLHWFAQQHRMGEEIDIWTRNNAELPRKGQTIGLCEFHLSPNHAQKKRGKNILKQARQTDRNKPHGVYAEERDRLDYFVSPDEVQEAYETLAAFLKDASGPKRLREVTLFGTLVVCLIAKV